MICNNCAEEGETSRLFIGAGTVTVAYSAPFYDENGIYHHHDPNWTTTTCNCSRGHKFTVRTKQGCLPCGIERQVEYQEVE